MSEITQENLNRVFIYDKASGELRHKHTTISGKKGELATFKHSRGYLSVAIGESNI